MQQPVSVRDPTFMQEQSHKNLSPVTYTTAQFHTKVTKTCHLSPALQHNSIQRHKPTLRHSPLTLVSSECR
jgi:hypothetical protein